MLTSLSIHNIVLIEKLTIEFRAGLCALTGETGAGKSILLDALGLALGGRGDASLIRAGCDTAQVTAVFQNDFAHPAFGILNDSAITHEDGEIILRRAIAADGRSRAWINDQPVSIGLLKTIGETLLEIHGQFATQNLLQPTAHRRMLDDFIGLDTLPTIKPWQEWKKAEEILNTLKEGTQHARAEESYLRQALEDIDEINPVKGEEETLSAQKNKLLSREKILSGLSDAYRALEQDGNPIRTAQKSLGRIADKAGKDAEEILNALDRADAEMAEALSLIQSLTARMDEGVHDLETIDDRLNALRVQARKHQCAIDDLPDLRQSLAARLNLIEHGEEALAAQIKTVEKHRKSYEDAAQKLSAQRKKSAAALDKAVQQELSPLKMEKAVFKTAVETLPESEWSAQGMDRVRFLVSTNPGSPPGALDKIASGGEMARFMLALKVVMSANKKGHTMIFDEVDTGISGSVADAVGERLARLAAHHQILVVTHSPQVASRAGHHYVVSKRGLKNVQTDVRMLDDAALRREEIARMLSGATITEEARAAAQKLIHQ